MWKNRDSLHLHILKLSSSSFLFWHKKRGKRWIPQTARAVSDKPRITHTCAQGNLSHPTPPRWIYSPGGKTTPNIISCQAQGKSRAEGDFTSFNTCDESDTGILCPAWEAAVSELETLPKGRKTVEKETHRELTWFHLWRRLSSSIAISKQFHRMKMPDTTRLSSLANQKNTQQSGSQS